MGNANITVLQSAFHVIYHVPGVVPISNVQSCAMKYVIDQCVISAVERHWVVVIDALGYVENPV
jgi:hypothetical protein